MEHSDPTAALNPERRLPPPRRARWPWWLAGSIVLLPVLLVAAALLWMSSSASLPQALGLAQRFLPEGHSLQFSAASGSISRGGRIDSLVWSAPGITLSLQDFELDWALRGLLDDQLQVDTLRAARVVLRVAIGGDAPPDQPFTMPAEITLPVRVRLPLAVDHLEIQLAAADGSLATHVIQDLRAEYRYDEVQHVLQLDSLAYGESRLQAALQLDARQLTLQSQVAASLRNLAPQMPFAMLAYAQAQGSLAGGDAARLELSLDAQEQDLDAPTPDAASLLRELAGLRTRLELAAADAATAEPREAQVSAHATLHPWRSQPVESLQLRASRLNAAAFHASAPVTLLAAVAQIVPAEGPAQSWDLTSTVRNGVPGGWDQQRLPVREIEARARLTPASVQIRAARVTLAGEPAGVVELAGDLPRSDLYAAQLQLRLQQVDLQQLMDGLPLTRLEGSLDLQSLPDEGGGNAARGWQAQTDISNELAGRLDAERLPLQSLTGTVRATPQRWQAEDLLLSIGDGGLRFSGHFEPAAQALDVRGELRHLPLAAIHSELASGMASPLSGSLLVTGALDQQLAFEADIRSDAPAASADQWAVRTVRMQGEWSPARLHVAHIDVDALGARIEGEDIDVVLPDLSSIQARLVASAPGLTLNADAQMSARAGGGTLSLQLASAAEAAAWLRGLPLLGEQLPQLQASGAASLQADWQGGWRQWLEGLSDPQGHPELRIDATLSSDSLRVELPEEAALSQLDVNALQASLQGNLAQAALALGGTIRADERAATLDVQVQMQRDVADAPLPGWQLRFERMLVDAELPGQQMPWQLALQDGLQVNIDTGAELRLQATAGQLSLTPPAVAGMTARPLLIGWQPLRLARTADGATRLQSSGRIEGIQPGWLDVLRDEFGDGLLQAAGFGTDLLLEAEWDLSLDEDLQVHARLQRQAGDLWVLGAPTGEPAAQSAPRAAAALTAGIRRVELDLDSDGGQVSLQLNWDTERAGVIQASATTRLVQSADGWQLADEAPLDGSIQARLQDLGMWGVFAPPGWRIQGRLDADLQLTGSVQTPLLRGAINAQGLNVRSVLDGVELHAGVLRATLDAQRLTIEELVFEGGTGSSAYISGLSGNRTPAPSARGRMVVNGMVDWRGAATAGPEHSGIEMDFTARLERMQVLVRNDRQLTLSGELAAMLEQGALQVRGDLDVDRATVLLPDAGAPTLGDDVIVVRDDDPLELIQVGTPGMESGRLESALPMDVEINLDLGRDLALQGYGITTRLEGELTLRSSPLPDRPFSLFGEVRTDEGRYRAWGQALNVETGEVAFNGSYENPSLNLLAIRPEIAVRAGVRVTGTLRAPQVMLYSDPPLPEAEKLSWVVLGRATAIGGGEGASVQRAALGLLAGTAVGGLANDLGVDELGLGDSGVSVGKRISDELYVTYEAGLSGAASTLYIFYDITRRFTVRAQSGEATAVDLIYSFDFD